MRRNSAHLQTSAYNQGGNSGSGSGIAEKGTASGIYLPFSWSSSMGDIAVNKPLRGSSHLTTGLTDSTRVNAGMRNVDLGPLIVPAGSKIIGGTFIAAAACIIINQPVIFPVYAAIGVFRINYADELPVAGNKARTFLGYMSWEIPDVTQYGKGQDIGFNGNIDVSLLASDGSGTSFNDPKLFDASNNEVESFPVLPGQFIGLELLHPNQNSPAEYSVEGNQYISQATNARQALSGYKNVWCSIQLSN